MKRQKARQMAMELLFGMSISKNSNEEILEIFIEENNENLHNIELEYIENILKLVYDNEEKIDEIISSSLKNWKMRRVSKINLTILRLAICEMLYVEEIPERVSINEAIELAKIYSDEKSSSFINGVLDKALKQLNGELIK